MLFWHLGATVALVRYSFRDDRMDLRFLMLGAVLPDRLADLRPGQQVDRQPGEDGREGEGQGPGQQESDHAGTPRAMRNFGEGHQGELFEAYRIEPDTERIRYYRELWHQES